VLFSGLVWDIDSSYSSNRGRSFPMVRMAIRDLAERPLWIAPSTNSYDPWTTFVHPEMVKESHGLGRGWHQSRRRLFGSTLPASSVGRYNERTLEPGFGGMIAPNHRV